MLLTIRIVELIQKKEFVTVALGSNHKTFILYIAVLNISSNIDDEVYPSRKAQIAHLKVDEAPTKVLNKYASFVDVFLPKLAIELPKYKDINNHSIKLING